MSDLENRLNDLEIKFSYQDEMINQLNLIVTEQQNEIVEISRILKSLKESSGQDGQGPPPDNERPPHY